MTVVYFATVARPDGGPGGMTERSEVQVTDNSRSTADQLDEVAAAVAANPSIAAKRSIALVSDVLGEVGWVGEPGDDGAAVDAGGGTVIACGEALWPPFVRA